MIRARREEDDDLLCGLLDIIAPGSGDVVALIQAVFDESYDDNILCVAGYIFTKLRYQNLARDWNRMLRSYKVPFFRMSLCAHGNGEFKHLSMEQRIAIETEAIRLIKKYASRGVAISLDLKAFKTDFFRGDAIQNPYSLSVWFCLMAVRTWADLNAIRGDIAYIFESGHQHQKDANTLMRQIFDDSGLKFEYRYVSHTFMDKEKAIGCQAADLLAWQWYTQRKRMNSLPQKPMRKDLMSLMEKGHDTLHGGPTMLSEVGAKIRAGTERYHAALKTLGT